MAGGLRYLFYGTYDDFSKFGQKNTHPPFSPTHDQKSTMVLFEIHQKHPTTHFFVKKVPMVLFENFEKDHPPLFLMCLWSKSSLTLYLTKIKTLCSIKYKHLTIAKLYSQFSEVYSSFVTKQLDKQFVLLSKLV